MERSLVDWLARIEGTHPATIALGLERILVVARRMGLERSDATVLTVGGTNGKGSCIAVMERLLIDAGASVGCYTSPHLVRYNERVRVQGTEATDDGLCEVFAAVEAARADVPLTFFEFGTLAALETFRRAGCDWLLLEVGLGGRLDAVNLIDPDIAVVTSIAIDHVDWLGRDRQSIAYEKAGIFRHARPVVCGDRDPPPALRATADVLAAPWYGIGEAFDGIMQGQGWRWHGRLANGAMLQHDFDRPPLLHAGDVACALQALALAGALPDGAALARVVPRTDLHGRLQKRRLGAGECLLDVAHNPAGIACLAERLRSEPARGSTQALFAAMHDKDVEGMLALLAPVVDSWIFTTLPEARALSAEDARAKLGDVRSGVTVALAPSVSNALEAAARTRVSDDRLVVCGSFHVVGPAIEWLDTQDAEGGELM